MLLSFDKSSLQNFSDSRELEWLETNGLGGWSGCSVTGCNTRRYHGLLMAAVVPPAERMLLVSKLDETIIAGGVEFGLSCNDYGNEIAPQGYQYLQAFQKEIFPQWEFEAGGVRLRKTICMVSGENTTLIRYEVLNVEKPFTLQLLPLIAARGYHQLQRADHNIFWDVRFSEGIFWNQPFEGAPAIFISIPGSTYHSVNQWYYNFHYEKEKYRGLDDTEDLFNHGIFKVTLKNADVLDIMISTENPLGRKPALLFENEKNRRLALIQQVQDGRLKLFTLAADQFIVKRLWQDNEPNAKTLDLKTVIAGYHWFTDWARDTMISLPGLCLQTGRFDDAKRILDVFSRSVSMGMLPNRFMDNHQPPEYNNVDGTLWFFNSVYNYLLITNDRNFVLGKILPVLKEIVEWHIKGTRYNIHADTDGLLYAGEAGQQLTWMDARIGSWVVTPRMGKPVEVQALWYNALKIFEYLLRLNGELSEAEIILHKSKQTLSSFQEKFWYAEGNYLFDLIDEKGQSDISLRPNQIFALSLPFQLIAGERAQHVMDNVRKKLYTPVGLRSLSPDNKEYRPYYGGNQFSRDSAYHQGTVWSWLLGPYIEAGIKNLGDSFRNEAIEIIERFNDHLKEACIGSISEIFDGDPPHSPRGCVAQAWGVAEILRVVKSYSLFHAGS